MDHLVLQVAYVKEQSGHREFEVRRELVAAVAEMSAERCRAILHWGKNNLGSKADEELKLGYITGKTSRNQISIRYSISSLFLSM